MVRRLFFDDFDVRAEFARRMHSLWLTRALRAGSNVPRIPTRLVRDGGFSAIAATAEGREWADRWWEEALEAADRT